MIRQGRQDPQTGQGRPLRNGLEKLIAASRLDCCALNRLLFVIALLLQTTISLGQDAARDGLQSVRARISWGGGSEQAWQVTARLDRGTLSEPQLLGLTPETPGSASFSENELQIVQPLASTYGGVDVTLYGPPDAKLVLDLHPVGLPAKRIARSISLEELRSGSLNAALDEAQNQLSVTRAPGDWLRLTLGREHLVFDPAEPWKLSLAPHACPLPSDTRSVRCTAKLVNARTATPILQTQSWDWELDEYGSGPAVEWDCPIPEREGVYDLIFELEPRRYQQISFSGFGSGRLVRRLQFVVLAREAAEATEPVSADWRVVHEQDLAIVAKKDRRSSFGTRPAAGGFLAAGNPQPMTTRAVEGRDYLELPAGQWQTVALPIKSPGKPHRLEIEYYDRDAMALGFSLLEPDAAGRFQVFGTDSGLVKRQEQVGGDGPGRVEKHCIEFWPSSSQPLLLINNRHGTATAAIGRIRLLSGPDRLQKQGLARDSSQQSGLRSGQRGRMAFYEFPLFPENFGAEFALDSGSGQVLTDWMTFYQGADRLVQHLVAHEYRGAMIAVVADGSTIYPSQLLEPTPRFDSGVFFGTGQDPIRKDVLELLLRMFTRAGLELVPVVTLNGRLPELERQVREGRGDAILLHDPAGRVPESKQELARYNPLSRTVQEQVQRVVYELVDRYGQHPAFSGVALTCQAETCTQLPGRRWGLELELVNRFLATEGQPALIETAQLYGEAVQQTLFGTARDAWLSFRAASLTAWYGELERTVRTSLPEGKLYLAGVDLYRMGDLPSLLSPSLQWSIDLPGALRDLGWDLAQLERLEHTVLMRPNRVAPAASLISERIEINLASLEQTRQTLSRGSYSAGLFVNRAAWARISPPQIAAAEGEAKLNAELPLVRWQPLSLVGFADRQRFAESLAHYDTRLYADGGWLLSSTRQTDDFFRVLSELPDVSFDSVNPSSGKSTVVIRQRTLGNIWHSYLVNPSPWSVRVELELSGPPAAPLRLVPEAMPMQRRDDAGKMTLALELEPFGLAVLSSDSGQLSLLDYRASVADSEGEALRTRLRRLQEQLVAASAPRPWNVLKNGRCDPAEENESGWRFDRQQPEAVRMEADPVEAGNSALHLSSQGQTVWVRSNELPVPETGRLSISAWLRIEPGQPQPPLRIAIEADSPSTEYYRFARVGSLAREEERGEQIAGEWKQFVVHFDDLPIHTAERCRIGFDLMGTGDVWIDRVEVFDRWFDQNDTKALTQLLAAAGPLLRDQAGWNECRLLLDSYWLRFLESYGAPVQALPAPQGLLGESGMELKSADAPEEEASDSPFSLRRNRRADKPRMFPFK